MVTWTGDSETKPAPGPLSRIQALVNTVDLERGQDRLADPAHAVPWLIDNDLLSPGSTPTRDEMDLLLGVREALRALLVVNVGGPAPHPRRSVRCAGGRQCDRTRRTRRRRRGGTVRRG